MHHFSDEGDWVADLYCGTGSTLVAALLRKQNGSAVDKGESQTEFVSRRIMTLDSKFSLDEEAEHTGEGIQAQEVQPPLSGELGTLYTLPIVVDVVTVEEGEEEDDAPPTVSTGDEELNDMIGN